MEAAVQVVCSSNDSNLHDNGHSVEPAPLTALADYVDASIMLRFWQHGAEKLVPLGLAGG